MTAASSPEALCRCGDRADEHRVQFPEFLLTDATVVTVPFLAECRVRGCSCLQYTEAVAAR